MLLIPITIWQVILSGSFLPGLRLPTSAAADVSRALGVARRDIWLTSQEVNELAAKVGVSEEVAPQVDRMTIWQRSLEP